MSMFMLEISPCIVRVERRSEYNNCTVKTRGEHGMWNVERRSGRVGVWWVGGNANNYRKLPVKAFKKIKARLPGN
jgi:hypothetical protein